MGLLSVAFAVQTSIVRIFEAFQKSRMQILKTMERFF